MGDRRTVFGMAAAALGVGLAAGAALAGGPLLIPQRQHVEVPVIRHQGRIPGPKRKKYGHPFRTRPLRFQPTEERFRIFMDAVKRICERRGKPLYHGHPIVIGSVFKRGGSAHAAYRALIW